MKSGLPKKYAKMGFKKGWALFKKTSAYKGKTSKSKTKKVRTMAKKRTYKKAKGVTTPFGKTFLGKVTKKAIPVIYGATRSRINDAVANSPVGKAIPAFELADEFTMLGINALATKFGARKNPIARRALQAMEDIELSSVGEELEQMFKKNKGEGGSLFA